MLAMLQTLGVCPSFSHPTVRNDNPYSVTVPNVETLAEGPQEAVPRIDTRAIADEAVQSAGTTMSTTTTAYVDIGSTQAPRRTGCNALASAPVIANLMGRLSL